MKTTNYENSKKLAEIGFKKEHDFCWVKEVKREWRLERLSFSYSRRIPAYDLETILEAFNLSKDDFSSVITEGDYVRVIDCRDNIKDIECKKENGETLADCAARLLIKLVEEKIIKLID